MNKNCFDIAREVVEKADKDFGREWKINKESYDIFKTYCDFVDKIVEENEADKIEVSIDRIKMTTKITMVCNYFSPDETIGEYYELVKRAVSFGFYQINGKVAAYLEFPRLWEAA